MRCDKCKAYIEAKQQCHRFPSVVEKVPGDFCLDFQEVEHEEVQAEERIEDREREITPVIKRKGRPKRA